ncbi:isocitrate lyase/phosphoenolpyruvate mutase family protein [Sphingobacterium sp. lm-10]|uniref:isocitrate lyase/PEP mutase family protein n=1 Tax=Sphingobacterium sp. lm-10 TaxID=2944904 RepID=UPI0020210C4D|nr:isocitrate lyase/phosphoenolpyruvate mutase family protein [Sphingobacterium sp. lm-10]MCL7989061.1 isocitrate lyase/phosphoenolpyruvate mutase family protein [Sphingobacterium sp. lm-10]
MTNYLKFKALHHQMSPLIMGNVWDVQSAKVYEQLKYQAIGTSSAAIAHTLGYEDGEQMPFSDLLFMVERIISNTTLLLSVDIESGYGKTPAEVCDNIKRLCNLGVVGINIEDSVMEKGERNLKNKSEFFHFLEILLRELNKQKVSVFINVRCDAFLLQLPNALEESCNRIELYQRLPIDGIFLPCITAMEDIKQIVAKTNLPLNVMCMPELADFETLSAYSVKRISIGNFVYCYSHNMLVSISNSILEAQSFKTLWN